MVADFAGVVELEMLLIYLSGSVFICLTIFTAMVSVFFFFFFFVVVDR